MNTIPYNDPEVRRVLDEVMQKTFERMMEVHKDYQRLEFVLNFSGEEKRGKK